VVIMTHTMNNLIPHEAPALFPWVDVFPTWTPMNCDASYGLESRFYPACMSPVTPCELCVEISPNLSHDDAWASSPFERSFVVYQMARKSFTRDELTSA